jgi:hypothetical protein
MTPIPSVLSGLLLIPLIALAAPNAQEILAKTKRASGGDAWNSIRTGHAQARLTTAGLTGKAESWDDLLPENCSSAVHA